MKAVLIEVSLSLVLCWLAHAAGHEHVCQTPELTPVNLKRQSLRVTNWAQQRADNPPNLRISVRMDSSITSLPNKDEITVFTQKAMDFWSTSLLNKYPMVDSVRVDRNCAGQSASISINGTTRSCCIGQSSAVCRAPTCNGAVFPEDILTACCWCESTDASTCRVEGSDGAGVDTDLLMLIIAKPVLSCSGTNTALAYASACYLEDNYWRPVVGMVNLCPMVVNHTSGLDPFSEIQLLKHEIAHALGFSSGLYAYWRAQDGSTLSPVGPDGYPIYVNGSYVISDQVVRKVSRGWETINGTLERQFTYIVTPTVTKVLQDFFNCPEIEGAELENHGSSGTAGSHFEMRLFPSEAMSGVLSEWLFMSSISLALMQDTGWYVANFTNAEPYSHGKGLGCKFARESCLTWIREKRASKQIPAPYCDRLTIPSASRQERRSTCPTKHDQVNSCTLTINSAAIDPMYRYFNTTVPNGSPTDDPSRYGGAQYADYCPYLQLQRVAPLDPTAYANRYRMCKNTDAHVAVKYDPFFETYGPSSICVRQTTPVRLNTCNGTAALYSDANVWGAGCYEVICGDKAVEIRGQGTSIYSCTEEHKEFTFQASAEGRIYQGTLVCPACEDACGTKACPMKKVDTAGINEEYLWEIATSRKTVDLALPDAAYCRSATISPQGLAIFLLLILANVARQ